MSTSSKSLNSNKPWHRKLSLIVGILYLVTFISIPTISLYKNVKVHDFVIGSSSKTPILVGAFLEITVALAGLATAIFLFKILKKQSEILALGLIASRTVEASGIIIGVACILTIVGLREQNIGTQGVAIAAALVTLYNKIFLVSQSLMPAFNDMVLGYLLYKSKLVPQPIAKLGLVGGAILIVGFILVIFGAVQQNGTVAALSALPVALFELTFGLWIVFKGFNNQAIDILNSEE